MAIYFKKGEFVSVLTDQPIKQRLDYLAPEKGCILGAFVEVPLGKRKVLGVVWGNGSGIIGEEKTRTVTRVLGFAPMEQELRIFLEKAAKYTINPLGSMLRLATRVPGILEDPKKVSVFKSSKINFHLSTKARKRVHRIFDLHGDVPFTGAELSKLAGVSYSVIKRLVEMGALTEEKITYDRPFDKFDLSIGGKLLNLEQKWACDHILDDIDSNKFSTTLLRGITGSGKTEVYLEAVAGCIKKNKQALVLLPEIALTSEFLSRVEKRFGVVPAVWHSGITPSRRRRIWKMAAQGGLQLVVGARSALFLPFHKLGLVVVDEEHDSSYKQEEGTLYNARDMAVLRGSLAKCKVILSSATPSLESWINAKNGKYKLEQLTQRFGAISMPRLKAIDMRKEKLPKDNWLSETLKKEIKKRIEKSEQTLLFINRRGYAPITMCCSCGEQMGCKVCDSRLVEHRYIAKLVCHQCGESYKVPKACPSCGEEGKLKALGPGIERITEEVKRLFPFARIVTLSSDSSSSWQSFSRKIQKIIRGETDIVIGTQLVAKGHNFPKLTLVGVIDADIGLQGSDLRAAEKTFQLIRQVTGRAGRLDKQGLALLQTHQPENPVIQSILLGDDEGFWQAEAEARKMAKMPPFGRLVSIIVSSKSSKDALALGRFLITNNQAIIEAGAEVFGPAAAPISRIRGRYRVRLLVKANKGIALQKVIAVWLASVNQKGNVQLVVDVDPQSFL